MACRRFIRCQGTERFAIHGYHVPDDAEYGCHQGRETSLKRRDIKMSKHIPVCSCAGNATFVWQETAQEVQMLLTVKRYILPIVCAAKNSA